MPSKREIHVDINCVAVIGAVSKPDHNKEDWKNVQTRRNYGLRPRSGNFVGFLIGFDIPVCVLLEFKVKR